MCVLQTNLVLRVYHPCLTIADFVRMSITPKLSMLAAALLLLLITTGTTCKEPTKPIDLPVTLEVVSVAVTDVRLKVTMNDSDTVRHYQLARDAELRNEGSFVGTDTILTDRNLAPNTSYTYRAFSLHEGQVVDSSDIVQVTTMDTNSRVYTWQVDSIGSYVSILRDVSVIADDDIWAVGMLGIGGADPVIRTHNALYWNGQEWEPVYIKYKHLSTTIADSAYGLNEVTAVHAIRSDAVWAAGSTPYFYDGETWTSYQHENSNWYKWTHSVMDIWARNDDDVYFVGLDGYAHHWDGTDFTRIDLGTDYDLVNVSGNEDRVFVVARNGQLDGSLVYEQATGQWSMLLESYYRDEDPAIGQWGGFTSVDVLEDTAYFGTSSGLLKYAYETETFELVPDSVIGIPFYTIEEVSVLAPNDIHLFNFDERYYHFNGLDWKRYDDHLDTGLRLRGADFHDNTAVMAGWLPGIGAMIIRGSR